MTSPSQEFRLEPATFADLKGWKDDDPSSLFRAMKDCRAHIRNVKPYRTGVAGLTADDLLILLDAAEGEEPGNAAEARALFEEHCQPFFVRKEGGASGFVTAFFEPEIEVSATLDETYRYPFYRRPDDLIDLDDGNRPAELDRSYMFGRLQGDAISAYPDRGEIDRGYLDGKGLEIAWAKSKVDVFFVHVQGAARLRYPDGRLGRITYAAKAGHPFSAVGRLLIDRGLLDRATISMQTIRDWLYAHPDEVDEVLWHNRSYIFFREADVSDPALGPIAAAKVPLVSGRSLAVDRLIHTFGFPFFIRSESLTHLDDGKPFARLMLALDTGSAIVGPARGDIFTGSGYDAGELAGTVRNDADFYILIPKAAAQRFG
ncbi:MULTISPECIES: murein transglycosylase A [unclassified Rhizobium]|jgi:membrane-bound lytic murein transglycosylase A|uniref:murein transglycosylase A n=1 Tax=unclassified Rhizobium TaxID=2613769 RepID=UPI0006473122|nr:MULTISPECIES: murein transglycosylase A [unclassified Rhizobium]MBN8953289.1 murein transglycosylase A [Rhizobium tropici]OJY77115.1 MAG: transglycosylase [Rhizobium sp. 60-20]RKD55643.1 membrane-bound lytic murein transglycosylase A [Rhizobium sp. WW_1]